MKDLNQKKLEIEKKIKGSKKLEPSTQVVIRRDKVLVDSREIIIVLNDINKLVGFPSTLYEIRTGLEIQTDIQIEFNVEIAIHGTNNGENKIDYCDFSNITFNERVVFQFVTFSKLLFLTGTEFKKGLEIRQSILEKDVQLNLYSDGKRDTYDSKILFFDCHFKNQFNAPNLEFHLRFYLRECKFDHPASFENSVFEDSDFSNNTFQRKADFRKCVFHDAVFDKTTFEESADFYDATFLKSITLFKVSFLKIASFTNVKFNKALKAIYCNTSANSIISFDNATFSNSLDISRANFICTLTFSNVTIDKLPKDLDFYRKTDKYDKIENPYFKLRGTYNLIKHSFEKAGNRIEALKFKSYEMEMYSKELEEDEREYTGEGVIMWANYISNNFGMDWWRGVLFTLWATYTTYVLMLLLLIPYLNFDVYADFSFEPLRHYLQILNITNWNIEIYGHQDYNLAYIPLFLGRIFIGFGYYQTIQAFRKYGK